MQATTVSFLLLLLLLSPQPNISYSLPPGCSYGKLPHSYGLWGCSRPTGGVCGLKRHIVCDSPIALKKTPPTCTSMAPSVPGTSSPRLSDPIIGSDMQTNIKEQDLEVKFPRLSGKVARRRKSNRLSSNLVVSWLCTTRYWLPSCQASPSHAIQMVWKNLLQGQNLTQGGLQKKRPF